MRLILHIGVTYLLIGLLSFCGTAQVKSSFERMEVEFARGCAPFTINISEIDSLGDISRTYTYESGALSTSDTFYTYASPGRYEIIQLLGEDIIPKTDTLVVEVLENATVDFNLFQCDQNQAILSFPNPSYDFYRIDVGSNPIISDSLSGFSNQITFQDTLALIISGAYFNAAPNCQVLDTLITRSVSTPISNPFVEYEFVCLNQLKAHVSFEGNTDQLYQLSIIDNSGATLKSTLTNWSGETVEIDSVFLKDDADQLCLRIDAISGCDFSIFETQQICQQTTFLNSPIRFAYASYKGDSIEIILDSDEGSNLRLNNVREGEREFITLLSDQSTLLSGSADSQPVFEIEYVSACLEDSLFFTIAPPFIEADKIGINHYQITSTASQAILNRTINIESQNLLFANTDSMVLADNELELRLSVGDGDPQFLVRNEFIDSVMLWSNRALLNYEYFVYIPEAFTPNDDGINDRLELFGLPTENFSLRIFNRWGELVFQTSKQSDFWNGRLSNGHIIEGTYVYRLNFYNSLGELFTQQGSFAVIRD